MRIRDSIVIERPIEEVFAFVLDQRNEPSYNPAMKTCVKATDGPIGVGTRFDSYLDGARPLAMTSELTKLQRPRLIASRTTMRGSTIVGTLSFVAQDAAKTRMTWDWDVRTAGLMRLSAPLIWLLGRRMERRIWTGLKRRLESGRGQTGGGFDG